MSAQPFVSVIVPVYNDAERLKTCIEALLAQSYPRDCFEVLVVDNGSNDETVSVARSYPVTVLVEDRGSSYAARNHALQVARGEVIAFTDSDCIPEVDWLERGVARLAQTPDCGIVAGKITVFFKDPAHPTLVELFESVTAFPQRIFAEQDHFGATANVFTWRTIVEDVGPFNASLRSSGDREWGGRVHQAGYTVVYADDARVRHPARSSFADLNRKYVRIIEGLDQLRGATRFSLPGLLKWLLLDLLPPWRALIGVVRNPKLNRSDKVKISMTMLASRVVYAWSRIQFEVERARRRRRS